MIRFLLRLIAWFLTTLVLTCAALLKWTSWMLELHHFSNGWNLANGQLVFAAIFLLVGWALIWS